MASTYTVNTGIELIANGEKSGTWGDTTNLNLEIIDRLTNGVGAITLSGTTHTLTTTDGALSPGQFKVLVFGGSPSGTNTVTISPNDQDKQYFVKNNSGQSVVLSQGSGSNVTIANGKSAIVFADGGGAGAAVTDLTSTFVPTGVTSVASGTGLTGGPITSSGTLSVATNGITNTLMRDSAALSVMGRSANSVGDPADIAAASDHQVLRRSGTNLGFGSINLASTAAVAGTLPVTNGGTGVTTSTGTGSVVRATSPSLVTPVLGTPSSGNLSSCTADGTNAVGFKNIPQNSRSAAYTLVLADSGKHIFHPSADTAARTFTIPANSSVAFPIGTAITFINQNGAGVVTIAITTDTMRLAGDGATGSRTLDANGVATCIKITSTEWIISGNGLT